MFPWYFMFLIAFWSSFCIWWISHIWIYRLTLVRKDLNLDWLQSHWLGGVCQFGLSRGVTSGLCSGHIRNVSHLIEIFWFLLVSHPLSIFLVLLLVLGWVVSFTPLLYLLWLQPRYKPHLSGFHISVLSLILPHLLLCSFGSHVLWGVHSSLNWPWTAAGFLLGLDICFYTVSCRFRIGPAGILWHMSKLYSVLLNFVLRHILMSFSWLRIPSFCLRGTVMPSSGMLLPQWNDRSFWKTILQTHPWIWLITFMKVLLPPQKVDMFICIYFITGVCVCMCVCVCFQVAAVEERIQRHPLNITFL